MDIDAFTEELKQLTINNKKMEALEEELQKNPMVPENQARIMEMLALVEYAISATSRLAPVIAHLGKQERDHWFEVQSSSIGRQLIFIQDNVVCEGFSRVGLFLKSKG